MRNLLSFSEAYFSSGSISSVCSFSAALHKSLSEQMRTSFSFAGSRAFFKFKALASCRQSAEGKLCLIASGVAEAISSSFTLVTANMSKTSLRKRETTVLKASLDNSFLLILAEKATVNSSMVQNETAKPCSLNSNIL